MPDKFDMPTTGTWEQRGGWVVQRLAVDLEIEPFQAAGIVGNLGYESREFKTLQEMQPMVAGSRGGWGWAQWTGPRRRDFEDWARARAMSTNSNEANYGFLVYELRGAYRWFLDRLKQTKTLVAATRLAHEHYERPADVLDGSFRSLDARIRYAERALRGVVEVPIAEIEQALAALATAAVPAQQALARHGFYRGDIDGDWGPISRTAALAYRKLHPAA